MSGVESFIESQSEVWLQGCNVPSGHMGYITQLQGENPAIKIILMKCYENTDQVMIEKI